jgi:23S rRNA pseudouridine2605 synthase
MTDNSKNRGGGGRGRPPQGPDARRGRARSGFDRPTSTRERGEKGDRPFSKREAEDKPRRQRPEGFVAKTRSRAESGRASGPRFEDKARTARSHDKAATPAPRRDTSDRIAKVMARAGLCSRRDAEAWIEAGRVSVNGEVIKSPALDVTPRDRIMVDGAPLPTRERTRLFLYHKPRGLVTTAFDPEGRPTVFGTLPTGLPRVVTIGRLDINTEGLLLLTNDGGLSRVIALPETGWLRRYRVRCFGEVTQAQLDALKDGVTVDGMHYGPIEAELQREVGDNVWLTLGLREGKNREVKRILEHLGLQVNRLIRISFGPFQLGNLEEGAVEEVRTSILRDQLGETLAQTAETDFDAPVFVYEDEDFHPRKREGQDRDERDGPPARRRKVPGRVLSEDGEEGAFVPTRKREEAKPAARPARRDPTEPLRSVWRAGEDETAQRPRKPRRGDDPKAARLESAGRAHSRAGTVTSRSGRAVLVERVERDKVEEAPREPQRARRREAGSDEERVFRAGPREERRAAPSRRDGPRGDDRPRKARSDNGAPRGSGDERPYRTAEDGPREARPSRTKRAFGDRPPRSDGERPPRAAAGTKSNGKKPYAGKAFDGKPSGDKPWRGKSEGGKSLGGRSSEGRSSEGKSFGGKPSGGKSSFGGKPSGGRPSRGRPQGDQPSGRKPPRGER